MTMFIQELTIRLRAKLGLALVGVLGLFTFPMHVAAQVHGIAESLTDLPPI